MLVKDTNYTNRVPVQLGTLHINETLAVVMREEYRNLSVAWARANFPLRPIMKSAQVQEPEYDLNLINGQVKITKAINIPPFETVHVPGLTESNSHFKQVYVIKIKRLILLPKLFGTNFPCIMLSLQRFCLIREDILKASC